MNKSPPNSPLPLFPEEIISLVRSAQKITILTGAGTSAESGIPTFRDAQTGLWARYKPEDLATPQAFQRNPRLVWEWYAWRRSLILKTNPNQGHLALAKLEIIHPNTIILTQNVDSLHQQAGSKAVIELHGNILRTRCSQEGTLVDSWEETGEIPPICPNCLGFLRPDVVWFGEALPEQAFEAALESSQNCDLFFSIGTSNIVEPAASLPYLALNNNIPVVEINPSKTPLTPMATYVIKGYSGTILPELIHWAYPDR